jgi:hypothetical protein
MLSKQQLDAYGNNPLSPPYLKGDIKGENPYLEGDIEGKSLYIRG